MEDWQTKLMIAAYGASVWFLFGFGKRSEETVYQFPYHGLEATIIREDIRWRWDNYYPRFSDGNVTYGGENFISDDGNKITLFPEDYSVESLEE